MERNNTFKKVKINFVRQDTNKTKRLKKIWRKPKGLQSKLRLNKRGHAKTPSQGHRSPKKIRLNRKINLIYNLKDLENIKEGTIASSVGIKKRVEILNKAKKVGIPITNVKEIDRFLKDVESRLLKKKEAKKIRKEVKKKTKSELEKKEGEKGEKSGEEEKKEISKKLTEGIEKKSDVKIVDTKPNVKQVPRATAPKQK
jgi:large subunit ribosomal protein L32e